MTDLLIKIFLRGGKCATEAEERKRYGTFAGAVGIAVNILLAIAKAIVGIISCSVAITADALNNLSDAGSSVISVFSFKISAKPADKGHPFGHARMEYIASMVVSFLILLVGVEMLIDSLRIICGAEASGAVGASDAAIAVLCISILVKLWLALFYRKIGNRLASGVIKAAATDSLSDCISTAAVLVSSLVIRYTGWQMIDAIVGIAVSFVIIVAGAKILIETKNVLLGEAPVKETVDEIKAIVSEYEDVIGMHDLMVHNYGPTHIIASFHAEVDGKSDIYHLHDTIDNLEREIKERLGILCTVHMDPVVTDDDTVKELRELLDVAMKDAGLELDVHDFRTVVGETHTNLIFDLVIPFEYELSEDEAIERVTNAVRSRMDNCYCVITVDRE